MQYEWYFWIMLGVVAAAAFGGALLGRIARLEHLLLGCSVWAAGLASAVAYGVRQAGAVDAVPLAAAATFLFSMMIGFAFALMVRRIVRSRKITPL